MSRGWGFINTKCALRAQGEWQIRRAHSSRRKIKSLFAQVSRTSEVPFGRQVPFSLAGFIVLAAYKVPARGTILNGSELRPCEVASLAKLNVRGMYMYSGASRATAYRSLSTYVPSLNFKKNKGTSSRRDFRRMVAEATFFQSLIVLEDLAESTGIYLAPSRIFEA